MDAPPLLDLAIEAMRSRGLEPDFPPRVVADAESARPSRSGNDVRDLRKLPWFSIDNADTRDLDQLSVVEPMDNGAVRLLVAVADVDVLVPKDGAIDQHAAVNTTSVYTAAGVFPMLPEVLSTDRTSLHEAVERAAVVVDMEVQADGRLGAATLYEAVVVNRAKLSYDDVSAWLDGRGEMPGDGSLEALEAQLRVHDDIARRMRSWRRAHGALEIDTVSARPVFRDGVLVDLRADERGRAKDLIADLMIAANTVTARFLSDMGFPSLRRFLQSPRRWDRIEALATSYGETLPAEPDAIALQRFLAARRDAEPRAFEDLSLKVVKMLGPGAYMAVQGDGADPGHFGLAASHYAHSTAPNRRYPDLVTQRLIKAAIAGDPPPYDLDALRAIAQHCTDQESHADAVERQVLKAAATLLLQDRIGDTFDAIVTGAAPKGTFVRIAQPLLEGRLERGFEGADVGDELRVRLIRLDPKQGHINFERVP
ncbi:RNB domain-containing ribonuclease [Ramlibacter algicola]|uniref:RNB domain-containing ribonuclease n=1 Tax=Ramlibacter algicola TaxID=2795217 RepID=A0A934Q264_9BURK|nr:RNB domain-containing ribonuclease [Ramlibacter algicola]MBK0393733.1 RNB domain-containing ribonuclease [Ramlibacter algicola]